MEYLVGRLAMILYNSNNGAQMEQQLENYKDKLVVGQGTTAQTL